MAKRPENKVPRRLKQTQYKKGSFNKRIKHAGPKLPSSWQILKSSLKLLGRNKRLFSEIVAIYAVLSILLVRGLSNYSQLSSTKQTLQSGKASSLKTGFNLVGNLFGSNGSSSGSGPAYQTILIIIMSLAVIWALRQAYEQEGTKKLGFKLAFYKSTGPLIPFFLVMLIMSLQLIPAVIGATVYSIVVNNGLAVSLIERLAWSGLFFILVTFSFYLVTTSIIAMYIVTLPEVTPLKAMRSAKDLVRYRHWTVMRKILFLPFVLVIATAAVMLPIALWLTPLAEWIFFAVSLSWLVVVHAYLYSLYRELL